MRVFSHRSVNIRGTLTVSIAMLIVLDHALAQPEINWLKVVVAMALSGFVAARAFMDQSLSMRAKTDDEPPVEIPAAPTPTAPKTEKPYPYN